jgi:hypothetical protein
LDAEENLPVCTVLEAQQRARWRNFPGDAFVLFSNDSAGDILMSARISIVQIVVKAGMLLGALLVFTLLLAALPAHRAPIQEESTQESPAQAPDVGHK